MEVNGFTIEPGADLRYAEFIGARLSGARLTDADLRGAKLMGAKLTGAYLAGVDLTGAKLTGAYLADADLRGANLRGAYLADADLTGANLRGAYLAGADLTGANLRGAYLADADLRGVHLNFAVLPHFQICPQEGSFIGYKNLWDDGVIKLEIPAEAKRTSSLVGRKCRAEFVKVLEGSGKSCRGGVYIEGELYHPDSYDGDIRVECTHGVHFFMTRIEAEEWH